MGGVLYCELHRGGRLDHAPAVRWRAMLDRRRRPLLDSWTGIGAVVSGKAYQGYDLQLTRYDARGWRATFYASGMELSVTSGHRLGVGADAVVRDTASGVGSTEEIGGR